MIVIGGATVGYGAWTSSGSGPVEARSIGAQAVTLTAAAGAADLYPGASGAVYFRVTNNNPYPIRIKAANFGTVTSSDSTACPADNVSTTNMTGLALDVAANSTSTTLTIAGAVTLASGAPDGCQNKTFTIATTVTGVQTV